MSDNKDFEKDLQQAIDETSEELIAEQLAAEKEFEETEEYKEIMQCKTPEDFRRVTEKYHPEVMKDGISYV